MGLTYKQYGKDGPQVSRLGFGVMRLPARKKGDWNSVNYTRSVEVLRAAMEAGVNLFDTHHGYHGGKSEIAIGKALAGWKGQHIYVQTKTPWYKEEPTEYFEKLLYEALEKLGVNCVDYLFHHSLDMKTWKKRGRKFIKFTDWALRKGLIRYRGCSVHDRPENIKALVDTGEFSAMLMSYNWMNPAVKDAIAHAADRGVGVSVMNPVGGGTLATETPQIMRLLPGAKTAPEIALRYVLATPGVVAAVSGMNTLDQIRENVAIVSRPTPMTEKQWPRMQARLDAITHKSRKFCTACGYCMPCKHGVHIPRNFGLLNQVRFFGRLDWARQEFARLARHKEGNKSAEACVQCGECMPKCPHKVPIIDQLHQVVATLKTAPAPVGKATRRPRAKK